jgi:hypothetical protein
LLAAVEQTSGPVTSQVSISGTPGVTNMQTFMFRILATKKKAFMFRGISDGKIARRPEFCSSHLLDTTL